MTVDANPLSAPVPVTVLSLSTRFVIEVIVAVSEAAVLIAHESTITAFAVVVAIVAVIGPVLDAAPVINASIGVV
jgi:hypothetical protein